MLQNFFVGNLDFPQIKKLKKVCSDVWDFTKMFKTMRLFKAKLYSKFFLFLLKWPILAVSAEGKI